MANYQIGDLIRFTYEGKSKRVGSVGRHDKFPKVLVLHPNWEGLVHGLNFNYLSDDEVNVIRMLLDPMFEMKYRDSLRRRNPNIYDELETIITGRKGTGSTAAGGSSFVPDTARVAPPAVRQGPASTINKPNSPRAFYYNIIRPFIFTRGWDPYRRYAPSRMSGVIVETPARVMAGEESLYKFKQEREQMATRARKALSDAKTPEDAKFAKDALNKIEKETSTSQRQSLLTWFSQALKNFRGPRFR